MCWLLIPYLLECVVVVCYSVGVNNRRIVRNGIMVRLNCFTISVCLMMAQAKAQAQFLQLNKRTIGQTNKRRSLILSLVYSLSWLILSTSFTFTNKTKQNKIQDLSRAHTHTLRWKEFDPIHTLLRDKRIALWVRIFLRILHLKMENPMELRSKLQNNV